MKLKQIHNWQLNVAEALVLQGHLADRVSRVGGVSTPHFIAGVDMSVKRELGMARGAVVVLDYPELNVVETKVVIGELGFPYIPGLLSFREAPLILAACEKLITTPDLFLVDGQGIAHPRRFGLASHLGLFLDVPTIGCAKSSLCGSNDTPTLEPGSNTEVRDKGETIGVALRTKSGVKPVYVSIGHKIDLQSAIHFVLNSCRGYRLPEPTRLAHMAAGEKLKLERSSTTA